VYTSLRRREHTIKVQMASLINLQERQQMPNQDLKDRNKNTIDRDYLITSFSHICNTYTHFSGHMTLKKFNKAIH